MTTLPFDDILPLVAAVVALVFMFLCICVVCDQHLVPAVETIIEQFDVPEEIAAVTLIAFGSSSPEILLNTVSAFEGSGALSMPAMLGSAIIAFGLIPPLCVLSTSKHNIDLDTMPILREAASFTLGLCLFTKIVSDGSANLTESVLLTSMYIFYVIVISVTYYCYKHSDHVPHFPPNTHPIGDDEPAEPTTSSSEECSPLMELTSVGPIALEERDASVEEGSSYDGPYVVEGSASSNRDDLLRGERDRGNGTLHRVEKLCLSLFACVSWPLVRLFNHIIPSLNDAALCSEVSSSTRIGNKYGFARGVTEVQYGHGPFCCPAHQVTLFRALVVVASSIVYVCVFAVVVVSLCGVITLRMGIDQTTVGATLVAFGAQLPDIVSSISLARDGYFNGAMANAIGSQVINITLGVGLPATVLCLYAKSKTFEIVERSDNSLKFLVGLLFLVVAGYCAFSLPVLSFVTSGKMMKSTTVSRRGALALLLLFVLVMGVYITFND